MKGLEYRIFEELGMFNLQKRKSEQMCNLSSNIWGTKKKKNIWGTIIWERDYV